MKNSVVTTLPWSTASLGATSTTLPEVIALGEHLCHCQGAQGRWAKLKYVGASMGGFVVTRLITSMLATSAVFAGAGWLLR